MGEGGGDGGRGMEGECEAGRRGRGFGRCGEDEGMEGLNGFFLGVGRFFRSLHNKRMVCLWTRFQCLVHQRL